MRYSTRFGTLMAAGAMFFLAGCLQDLNVTNPNAPDTKRAFSTPEDVATLVGQSFNDWYIANQYYDPNQAFSVMADAMAASWGNFGMRFNSNEPRLAYNNNKTNNDAEVAQEPWEQNYAALGEANDALRAIAGGLVIRSGGTDVTETYKALALFVQGAALGNIALIFDQGIIVDETVELPAPLDMRKYGEVSKAALAKLDAAIALAKAGNWTIPEDLTPGLKITSARMVQLANTMAARLLAYTPRNAAENAQVDWAKVYAYANAGISTGASPFDFTIVGDGIKWWDGYKGLGSAEGWMRVHQRLINMMDPTQPAKFPGCDPLPESTSPLDKRLETDFTYFDEIPFDPGRGCYHFSNYAHTRYEYMNEDGANAYVGPAPMVLQAENDLLIAEALVRTGGDLGRAATLVNKTRVGRGNLPQVPADAQQLLSAIQHEQDIELLLTGGGIQYYNRRRIDGLQAGTPRHLPVPQSELDINSLPTYTFGGAAPNPVHPDQ